MKFKGFRSSTLALFVNGCIMYRFWSPPQAGKSIFVCCFSQFYSQALFVEQQDDNPGDQHIEQCEGDEFFPPEFHQLVVSEPGNRPPNPHEQE